MRSYFSTFWLDGLAAAAGDVDRFVGRRELVVLPVDLHLQAGAADVVFEREVGEVGVEVERAGARLAQLDRVPARRRARRLRARTCCRR